MVPVASAFKSSFVYSGSAIVNGVNMITPHLAGAVDILAVRQPDGSLKSTPFYVRFGKYTSYRAKEKTVDIVVNGIQTNLKMHLSSLGNAYFVTETTEVYDHDDELNLSGMMSPSSGYSSADDDVPYASEKLIKSIKSEIHVKEENTMSSKDESIISLTYEEQEVKVDNEQSYLQGLVKKNDVLNKHIKKRDNGLKPLLVDSLDYSEQKIRSVENKCLILKTNETKNGRQMEKEIIINNNKESQMNRAESCPNLELNSDTSLSLDKNSLKEDDEIIEISKPSEKDMLHHSKNLNDEETRKTRSEPDEENKYRFLEIEESHEKKIEYKTHNNEEEGYMGDNDNEEKEVDVIKQEEGLEALKGFELSLCGHLLTREMSLEERKKVFENNRVTRDVFMKDGIALTNNPNLVCRWSGTVYPWNAVAPMVLGVLAFGGRWDNLIESNKNIEQSNNKINITNDIDITREQSLNHKPRTSTISSSGWSLWPFAGWGERKTSKSPDVNIQNLKNDDISMNQRHINKKDEIENEIAVRESIDMTLNDRSRKKHRKVTKKTLMPTSEQLAACNFVDGQNTIHFNIGDSVKIQAYVYVIDWTSRLVISDIDGTVTKSDILGHLLPQMGFDWTHPGVAHLLSNIKSNGYEIMYLSSRAIAQANITRDFLHRITQEGHKMPSGPVIISPHGILPSLYRELILRRPHDFKISTLQDIRILFPKHWNPFYAGFGNRDTDVFSYEKSGVPRQRIFTINSKGQILLGTSLSMQTSTWSSLQSINELVDEVFPPNVKNEAYAELREEFNDYHYWKFSNDTWLWDDDDDPILHDIQYNQNKNFFDQNYLDKDDMNYFPGQLARSVLND